MRHSTTGNPAKTVSSLFPACFYTLFTIKVHSLRRERPTVFVFPNRETRSFTALLHGPHQVITS